VSIKLTCRWADTGMFLTSLRVCTGEQWVAVDSDRHSCLACLSTMVRNTADCQPLYDDVLSLYASFGMALPTRPPLLLVRLCTLCGQHPPGQSRPVYTIEISVGLCTTIDLDVDVSLGVCMYPHTTKLQLGKVITCSAAPDAGGERSIERGQPH
jgi:hypothetical protein